MKDLYNFVASFVLLAGLSLPAAACAPSHRQTQSSILLTGPKTISATFPAASNAGNLIIAQITWDRQTRTLASVVDSKGNDYHLIGAETNWGTKYRSALYYAYNIDADASKIKVTATLNNNTTALFEIYISEYSNVLTTSDPLDKNKTATGTGTAINTGSVTTTAGNELVWGIAVGEDQAIHGGTGYNVRSTDQDNIVEDKTASTAGSFNASFTAVSSTNWVAQVATFKPLVTLPVTLISFDARTLSNKTVELDWTTTAETSSAWFEIQHSGDGQTWTAIGRTNAAANTQTSQQYSYTDPAPYAGFTWYRLKQVDQDDNFTFSKTLTTHRDQAVTLHVYPNPTVGSCVVEGATQPATVFNTAGQRMAVRVNTDSRSKQTLDLSTLPKGAYFIKTGDNSTLVYKQ
ncbi:T9SS type A sorting domain-containing protein [Puia sp. P3]|uniref:T9SS type A sorting domain-containing protein n=1 Tax=Puia sp. P3 TaxID=3423952 RepID=UPI003D669C4E